MLVYILQESTCLPSDFIKESNVILLQDVEYCVLPHSDSLSMDKLGIPLSKLEINQFNNHYSIWRDFSTRADCSCLIIESMEFLISCKDLIGTPNHELEDLEIILPFNPFKDESSEYDITYTYGKRMGVASYYINKATVKTLLKYQRIELPVDEFFLHMSNQEILTISFLENNLFHAIQEDVFLNDRNENKLRTILSTNNWDETDKIKIIDMLKYVFSIAVQLDIPLFLSDGTLLGYVRNSEIMGWDDDIDISTESKYIQLLISKIEDDDIYRITKHVWGQDIIYYKVWHNEGEGITGYDYTFPFIDIWLYALNDDIVDFGYGKQLPYDTVFPLMDKLFYHIPVKIPKNFLYYLDESYTNWRTRIQIYSWNHKKEKPTNLPLQAVIQTSPKGKF